MKPLRRVCAWCRKLLGWKCPVDGVPMLPVHGKPEVLECTKCGLRHEMPAPGRGPETAGCCDDCFRIHYPEIADRSGKKERSA